MPNGIVPTTAVVADVLAMNARATGASDARNNSRRERWTYTTHGRRIAVTVNVRDDDFRTSLDLDGLTSMAGRTTGVRWRGDGNGIVHGIQADLQGDALDRPPQAIFRLDPAACSLAGEARLPAAAWVIDTRRDGDKEAFLYIDQATGAIVREVMRDGQRIVTTTFDRFAPLGAGVRARHWQIDDGDAADALDVIVDDIEARPISGTDLAFPVRRTFASVAPLAVTIDLPATFRGDRIELDVGLGKTHRSFLLDTGTTSITLDAALAQSLAGVTLQHAVVPTLSVGPLELEHASILGVPLGNGGILGFDFFFGHVIEIDYRKRRVRVLSPGDARAIFADPQTGVIAMNVDQGLPLVHAAFGTAQGESFALDSGSPRLYVMQPFVSRNATEIAKHWTSAGPTFVERYLEGGIEVQPYRVAQFSFANAVANNLLVGAQVPSTQTDDLAIPFDGIIGTDIMRNFDFYFDYDNGRLGVRR